MGLAAGLVVTESLVSGTRVELSERDAAVLWTLYREGEAALTMCSDKILEAVNAELSKAGRPDMSRQELTDVLKRLVELRSIEKQDTGGWRLRERVTVEFR